MFTLFLTIFILWCFLSAILLISMVIAGSKKSNPASKTRITTTSSPGDLESFSMGGNQVVPSGNLFEIELVEYIS